MVSNWNIEGNRNPLNMYHVTKEGARYAKRNIHGTMGNLLNSYNQSPGYQDEPLRKRLTNSDAENIAQKNQHGSLSNVLYTQNEQAIRTAAAPVVGIPRLKSTDALKLQNKSLTGSMAQILNVPQNTKPTKELNVKHIRATTADAKSNVQFGQVGTIGALVLNPGAKNICSEREKFGEVQRLAADARNAAPAERVRSDTASRIAQQGRHGTYGILSGNAVSNINYSQTVAESFTASQQVPRPRTRNTDALNNLHHGSIGKLGVLLQGQPLPVNSSRNKYNAAVYRSLSASCIQPVARVRPEAAGIAAQHQGHIKNLLVDVTNKPKQRGAKCASIEQKNYNMMKKKEKDGRKRLEAAENKPLWKNSKYDRTESRLKQWMDTTYGSDWRPRSSRPRSSRPRSSSTAVSRTKDITLKKSASETCVRNFIAENAAKAKAVPVRADPLKVQDKKDEARRVKQIRDYQRGVVPEYLQSRVAVWKEEEKERIAKLPDPTVPAGHIVMMQEERIQTLNVLIKSRDELLLQLQNMPLRNDTLRIHNTRTGLEGKLGEIEDAVKIFSRPRVFIKQE